MLLVGSQGGRVSRHWAAGRAGKGAANGGGPKRIANGPPTCAGLSVLDLTDFRAAQAGHTSQQGLFQEIAPRAGPPTRAGCLVALEILLISGSEF